VEGGGHQAAAVALFLRGPAGARPTGQVISVNGGTATA